MNSRLALNPLKIRASSCFSNLGISTLHTRRRKLSTSRCTRLHNSQRTTNQQQLNLSVLRFTLGIPGLNESYLPRWIGYAFGLLLLLNHFVGSNSATVTPSQLLISIRDVLCVRGYWNIPENGSKVHVLDRFEEQIKWIGLSDLKDTLYFPQCAGKFH